MVRSRSATSPIFAPSPRLESILFGYPFGQSLSKPIHPSIVLQAHDPGRTSFSERLCDLNHITENSAWLLDATTFLVGGLLRIRWLSNQCVRRSERAYSCSSIFFQRSSLTLPPIDNPDERRGGIQRYAHGQALIRKILTPSRSST